MHVDKRNVPGLAEPAGYKHFAMVTGARLVFVAGQVPLDEKGDLIGSGDPLAQGRQCLRNLAACLAAAGASPEDAVRTTVYEVATERASPGQVWRELLASELGAALRAPATLVGVAELGYPGQLVEIECTAAVPAGP